MASRIAELAGYGRRFGLLIADIDRFKLFNDRHGHATGDAALGPWPGPCWSPPGQATTSPASAARSSP